jgi:uncharacterized protein (DUF1501 family)
MTAMLTRRALVRLLGGVATLAAAPGLNIAFARAVTDKRLVVVLLRGAMDGLAAVPPYADPHYREMRGALALAEPGSGDGALDLDGRFGLHPALGAIHPLYGRGELLVLHAVATPYRERSHFDAQDMLENGTPRPHGAADGWLARAVTLLGPAESQLGLAVGDTVPLLLRGETPVATWAPQVMPAVDPDFLERLAALYRGDPLLGPALIDGISAQRLSDEVMGGADAGKLRGAEALKTLASGAGKLLADPRGPRIAAIDVGGWDTHAGQGVLTGRLAAALKGLGDGLAALAEAMKPVWHDTVVVVATEFGRTVAPNGTGGTDHGTAGAAFLLGGAVAGGRVVADWPGLAGAQLYEGRDLAPTVDLRAALKAMAIGHLGLPRDAVERVVFPESGAVTPLADLLGA